MSINMSIRFFRVFLLILVSLVSFTTFPSKGYSEDDWVLAVRDVKVLVYYNNTNICIDRESKQIKVWVKFIWTEKGLVEQNLKKDNISDTLCVYYINYNQRKQYLNRRINYSYSGIIIDDFSYKLNWEDILPDSIAGQVLNKILENHNIERPQVALALTGSQVFEQVQDSVVVVIATDEAGKTVGQGSGVLLPYEGIITNYHVIKAGKKYKVIQFGKAVPASLEASNPDKDLALLSPQGLDFATPARLGQTSKLKVGESVYAVGAPYGLELSFSEGIVSQLRDGNPPLIQTTAAVSPGSSGGGLFNADGELVGIITFQLKEGQNLNFALPVEWLTAIARTENWLNRAVELENAQDWSGLLTWSHRWTSDEPGNPYAPFYLGIAYDGLGRYGDAIVAFKEAVRLKPSAEAWNSLGNSYVRLAFYRSSIGCYQEAIKLEPDSAPAWWGLGNSYARTGNRTAALEAAKELRKYNSQKADELLNFIMKQRGKD
ncbi:MAG: trypsin-like peptidase domain-containing protein [Desulfobaccales bacterium]